MLEEKHEKKLQPFDPNLAYSLSTPSNTAHSPIKSRPQPTQLTPLTTEVPLTIHWWKLALAGLLMPFRMFFVYMFIGAIAIFCFTSVPILGLALGIFGLAMALAAAPALAILAAIYFTAKRLDDLFIPEALLLSSCAAVFTFATGYWLDAIWKEAQVVTTWKLAIVIGLPFLGPMLSLLLFTFMLTYPRFYRIPETLRCTIIMLVAALPTLFGFLKI
jgi:hypothetical protein